MNEPKDASKAAGWMAAAVISLGAAAFIGIYLSLQLADAEARVVKAEEQAQAVATRPPETRPAPAPTDAEIIRSFTVLYYDSHSYADMTWLGVPTLQNPPDMWAIQELLLEVRPDYVIEAGTFHGGSALYFAMVLEAMGGDGKVLTIDIEPQTKQAERFPIFKKRIEVFTGSSTGAALVKQLGERTKGKKVLVMLDSDHRHDHVLNELRAYGPMISEGSYLVVQDTNVNGHPVEPNFGPGPWEAVTEYLAEHPEFEPDRSREKFLLTFTPRGYLKRKVAAQ